MAAAIALTFLAATGCGSDSTTTPTPVASVAVSVSPEVVTLIRGISPTRQISATVTGASNGAVTYTSVLPGVATVSSTGLVTGVTDGYGTIVVTSVEDPSKKAYVAVNVVSTIVSTSPAAIFISEGTGETRQLTATVQNNPNTGVTWSSSNTAVATVSSTGLVTAVAAGTANIVATSNGDPTKAAVTSITVDPPIPAGAIQITSGSTVDVSGGTASSLADDKVFYIKVPAGKTLADFKIVGPTSGVGDVDMYVRAGRPADPYNDTSTSLWACWSWNNGVNEECTVTNPQQRIYYITLDGYAAYSSSKFSVTLTP